MKGKEVANLCSKEEYQLQVRPVPSEVISYTPDCPLKLLFLSTGGLFNK